MYLEVDLRSNMSTIFIFREQPTYHRCFPYATRNLLHPTRLVLSNMITFNPQGISVFRNNSRYSRRSLVKMHPIVSHNQSCLQQFLDAILKLYPKVVKQRYLPVRIRNDPYFKGCITHIHAHVPQHDMIRFGIGKVTSVKMFLGYVHPMNCSVTLAV